MLGDISLETRKKKIWEISKIIPIDKNYCKSSFESYWLQK